MAEITRTTLIPSALQRLVPAKRPAVSDQLATRDERAGENPSARPEDVARDGAPAARPVVPSPSPVSDLSAALTAQEDGRTPAKAEPPQGDERRRGLAAYAAAPGASHDAGDAPAASEGEGLVVSSGRSFDLRA